MLRACKLVIKLNTKKRKNPTTKWANALNRQFSEEVLIANKYVTKVQHS
jgi:hypothetical protein